MGHQIHHFDHCLSMLQIGRRRTAERILEMARGNGYDAVLYHTAGPDREPILEPVREAGRYAPIIAWNSDDDWKWDERTSRMAPYFTFMFTTSPHIYEQNHARFPNLRLSQWGCLEGYSDFGRPKDLDFTFVGHVFSDRAHSMRALARRAGLRVYGHLSGRAMAPSFLFWPGIRRMTVRIPAISGRAIPFERVHDIWNRSRISYTPMEAPGVPAILQIKARAFEQGLSGAVMICRRSPNLVMH